MPSPTLAGYYEVTNWATSTANNTVYTVPNVVVQTGDILVVVGALEVGGNSWSAGPAGNGLTYTQRQKPNADDDASHADTQLWTATATGNATFDITATKAGASTCAGLGVFVWRNAALGTPVSAGNEAAGTGPSLAISTVSDNSAVAFMAVDFNAADGASRTWRTINSITPTSGNGGEKTYARNASSYTVYVGCWSDAGAAGSKTTGLSAPTGQLPNAVAIEIQGTGAAAEIGGPWFTSPLSELPWDEDEAPWALRPNQPPIPMEVWTSPTVLADQAIALDDTAAAADALTVAAAVPLADTATATDALTVTTAVPLTDTATAADALTVAAAVPLADTASASDALALTTAVPLADTAAADDALSVAAALPLADTASAVDALAVDTGGGSGTYVNHVTLAAARNGTSAHTVHPDGTGGTVVDGSAFTPTAGRFLLCFVEGSVTSTTPTGWTLPSGGSAVGNTGLYGFYRSSASGTSADEVATTHNGSNYPVIFDFYEFDTGTTFVDADTAAGVSNGAAGPDITGLTGTNWVAGIVGDAGATGSNTTTWDAGTKEVDHSVANSGTDGYAYSLTYIAGHTSSTVQFTATLSEFPSSAERLVYALNVPDGSTPISLADTAAADDALTVAVGVPLADTAAAADALTTAAAAPLADTATATDALSVSVALTLTDTAAADDALAVLSDAVPPPGAWFLSPFAELPFAAPAPWEGGLNKGVVVLEVWTSPPAPSGDQFISLSDTATATDALTANAAVPLTETATATDALVVTVALTLTDTATAAETLTAGVPITLTDTATATDALTATAAVPLADTATATDALSITATVTLTDTATGTDLLAVTRQLALPETATATDALTLTATVPLADTASALDSLTISVPITLADVASATDALVVSVGVPIATPVRSNTGHQFVRSSTGEPMSRVSTGNQMFRSSTEIE